MVTIPLFAATPDLTEAAMQIAATFQLAFDSQLSSAPPDCLYLTSERLELRVKSHIKPIYVDFINGGLRYRRQYGGGRHQPLGRAIGLKKGIMPTVVDGTAGLGRDAFILACLGCQVQMIERSPIIAALLADGLARARQDQTMGTLVKERIQLIHADTVHWLQQLPFNQHPAVIYLDPMYPPRRKSALVKKEMRIFRLLLGEDEDADLLLQTSLKSARQRVVVKRPKHGLALGNNSPTMSIHSENTRFDVYLTHLT